METGPGFDASLSGSSAASPFCASNRLPRGKVRRQTSLSNETCTKRFDKTILPLKLINKDLEGNYIIIIEERQLVSLHL